MNYTAQLARDGNLLKRPAKKGKAPKKRLPKVTTKRAKQNREYLKRRAAYLLAHPHCMALNKIHPFLASTDMAALRKAPWALQPATEIHHVKRRRSLYLNDESTWLAVCRWSHLWIHNHPAQARAIGLLA